MKRIILAAILGSLIALLCGAAGPAGDSSMFKLTERHLNLLRNAVVLWAPVESGAPAVVISPLQIGDGEEQPTPAVYADIARRAGLPMSNPPTAAEKQQVDDLVADLPEALAQLLAHGRLEAGTYRYENPLVELPFASKMLPPEIAALAKERVVSFALTGRHVALLRHARWRGLFMNPKRPYGDFTYFELDMAEILGEQVARTADGKLPDKEEQRLWKLHTETLPALQLYLQKASITPGDYPRIEVEGPLFGGPRRR
jgi:hypothetical protein